MSGLSLIATAGPLFFAERAEGAMWQSQIVVEVRDCPAARDLRLRKERPEVRDCPAARDLRLRKERPEVRD